MKGHVKVNRNSSSERVVKSLCPLGGTGTPVSNPTRGLYGEIENRLFSVHWERRVFVWW
jgi:hypothetical protein